MRYLTPNEVLIHNSLQDCWVSFCGKVFNLTPFLEKYKENYNLVKVLGLVAGQDISHWFDCQTKSINSRIDPKTGLKVLCIPKELKDLSHEILEQKKISFWDNEQYLIGFLTKKVRPLRIVDVLISCETVVEVCSEESFHEIKERYRAYCKGIDKYVWKFNGKLVDMDGTLEDNGIEDERNEFLELGLPESCFIPGVLIYYQEDLEYLL